MRDPKNFLKAPLAPIYTTFEGGARRKNAIFWSKLFKKGLKTPFWPVFSKFSKMVDLKNCSNKLLLFVNLTFPAGSREQPDEAPAADLGSLLM